MLVERLNPLETSKGANVDRTFSGSKPWNGTVGTLSDENFPLYNATRKQNAGPYQVQRISIAMQWGNWASISGKVSSDSGIINF